MVTGAGGRVGRILRACWQSDPPTGLVPLWAGRGQGFDIDWDILSDAAPRWPEGAMVLHLAGLTRGDAAALSVNARLIPPLLSACRANGVRALLAASTIAVLRPGPDPLDEDAIPDPQNDYGRAKLAAEHALAAAALPTTVLRIGNIAGADALLSRLGAGGPIRLDPVQGQSGGPIRSWIGPQSFARCLAQLCRIAAGTGLPKVLNIATDPPLAMADLLRAAATDWHFGPLNPMVVPTALLKTRRLQQICPLPTATAATIIAELKSMGLA